MKQAGFTLIELLVVVMIVSVLTAVAMPQYRRAMDRAKAAEAMELLPALFEARERWMVEHQCEWTNSGYTCPEEETVSFQRLDIESPGTISNNGLTLTTKNFTYSLVSSKPNGSNQRCISASPSGALARYGDNVLYFRGDKLKCATGNGDFYTCETLNFEEGGCE